MPIYDYLCLACGVRHEFVLLASESPPETCPDCGGELSRRYGRVGVQLRGWGFSKTDSLVPERPGRADFDTIRDKAAELFDG